MVRSLLYLVVRQIALFACSVAAFGHHLADRAREVWREAFPHPEPLIRSPGVRLSREDAKPLARRLRDYAFRLTARTRASAGPWMVAA